MWNDTKKGLLQRSGKNTQIFVKIYPKLKNKSLFDAIFYGAWQTNFFRC